MFLYWLCNGSGVCNCDLVVFSRRKFYTDHLVFAVWDLLFWIGMRQFEQSAYTVRFQSKSISNLTVISD